jgi:Na+/phosphate symporter
VHVANNHAGLLDDQVEELRQVQSRVIAVIQKAATILLEKKRLELWEMGKSLEELKKLTHEYDRNQVARIQDDTSKTRLSILFYAFMWDSRKIAEQTDRLLQIFQDSLPPSLQSPPGRPPSDPQSHL